MLFNGTLQKGKELPRVEALIQAGSDLNFNTEGNSETPLIGAASLGVEDVGLCLLEARARPDLRGLSGETALHWAATLGEDRLVARLIPGPGPQRREVRSRRWTGRSTAGPTHPPGNHGRQREVVALLVAAGATVEPQWLEFENVRGDPAMLTSLRGST